MRSLTSTASHVSLCLMKSKTAPQGLPAEILQTKTWESPKDVRWNISRKTEGELIIANKQGSHPTRIRGIIGEQITLRATKAIITSSLRITIITTMVAESTYLTDHSRTDHSLHTKTEKETEQDPESLLIDYHPLERARMSLSDPVECAQQIPQLRMFGALSQEIGRMEDTLTRSNLKCLTHHLPSHHVSELLHLTSRHRARPDPLVKSLQLHLQDAQLSSDCLMETLMPQREKDAQRWLASPLPPLGSLYSIMELQIQSLEGYRRLTSNT
ncbi:hypothetical protein F2Q70_00015956 [Brassica cretica]|uniref:Uncharacterized protein n=1 Tax=Brassica cretica TaxID=69181 RepID=A0A8S9HV07_BRACR|nr:hypothetical protein F2Q70_00015956 [Brassica cretica]KAF2598851.1 hypothetical protein F2Q68_00008862 [Brassica cretica]